MTKIVLGARPKNFKREVTFKLHEGGNGTIVVTYKYRTRSEYGAFVDERVKASKEAAQSAIEAAIAAAEAGSVVDTGMQVLLDKSAADNVAFILDAVEGWNLDAPYGRPSVEQLADELPQAVLAIIENYRVACTEGRLGN